MNFDAKLIADEIAADFQPVIDERIAQAAAILRPYFESPIELRLYVALHSAISLTVNLKTHFFRKPELFEAEHLNHQICVAPQYPWNGYRIDMAFGGSWFGRVIFVECDGHEFHERTKEHAARDRQKDRLAQLSGITILRFTGSEIHRNLLGCCTDIINAGRGRDRGAA